MRKPIIVGNWKMNLIASEAQKFVETIKKKIPSNDKVESVIAPPALLIDKLVHLTKDTDLKVAAQNSYYENFGAFTGENSPSTLSDLGVQYVIIGHSERREYFHETDKDINNKAKAIFINSMIPIICCGESLKVYEANETKKHIENQIISGLSGLSESQVSKLIIAYEPIWAIGTGKSADPLIANNICKIIREKVRQIYGVDASEKLRIQYGGSVNPKNISQYMDNQNIDGALVGGASLNAESFLDLLNTLNKIT